MRIRSRENKRGKLLVEVGGQSEQYWIVGGVPVTLHCKGLPWVPVGLVRGAAVCNVFAFRALPSLYYLV
jgi:hypothetical protein